MSHLVLAVVRDNHDEKLLDFIWGDLCGKDNLLDGSYQRDLAKTMGRPAMEKQKATRVNAGLELEKI